MIVVFADSSKYLSFCSISSLLPRRFWKLHIVRVQKDDFAVEPSDQRIWYYLHEIPNQSCFSKVDNIFLMILSNINCRLSISPLGKLFLADTFFYLLACFLATLHNLWDLSSLTKN